MKLVGKVDNNGKPKYQDGIKAKMAALFLTKIGKFFTIEIKFETKKRTINQNDFWWGVWIPIIEQGLKYAGWENMNPQKTHSHIKNEFLRDIEVNDKGEAIGYIKDTKDLNTTEFNELMMDVELWAKEFLGVTLPEPDSDLKRRWR